jgi:hypothetical protein
MTLKIYYQNADAHWRRPDKEMMTIKIVHNPITWEQLL